MTKKKVNKVRVGISVGDPNGIGTEVILKTFQDNRMLELFTPIVFGAKKILLQQLKKFNINFLRSHMKKPELDLSIKSVQEVIQRQSQFRMPSFVIARKQGKFWKVTEKIFIEEL